MEKLHLRRPDDWHIHLRDDAYLERTVTDASQQFHRVLVMPNLQKPIVTVKQALDYQQRILEKAKSAIHFQAYMTLYLTDNMSVASIQEAAHCPEILAAKLYPAGATTNSNNGVTDIENIYPLFEAMEKQGLVLCIHGEVTQPEIDIFDREAIFIEQVLSGIIRRFPELKIVLEHITTSQAVNFIMESSSNVAASITAHHLLLNRNDLLVGGIKPHHYCLPVLKRHSHQEALLKAASSGNPKFFLGSDSAPHSIAKKESACGCAGIYTAYAAIELYAKAFEEAKALDKLNDFASRFGAEFYGLNLNTQKITLRKESWQLPEILAFGDSNLVPFMANQTLNWRRENL